MDLSADFFSLFELPRGFRLNLSELDSRYRDVQAQVHPDRFAHASETERRLSMQWATHANEAYQTLKKPLERAKYLLHLAGHDIQAENNTDGLVALNTAFAQDGVFIYVPKGVVCTKPIQIINLLMSDENLLVQYRNLIVLEESSQANVLVCDHSLSPKRFISNVVTEIAVGANAQLEFVKMQNEHNDSNQLTHTYVKQERDSKVVSNVLSLHGGFIRNNLNMQLAGEGADAHAYGLYLTDRTQHTDNYTFIDHAVPNCTSNELYKGILDDQATGAFNGRVLVRRDAQKTQAYQSNNNLLLTADAKMNTKPQLEIYADDVKCSHGATIGQIDYDALFYMRARGIGEREAKLLLMFGFAHEVVKRVSIESLRERVHDLVNKRLRGELSRCHNCPMHCC